MPGAGEAGPLGESSELAAGQEVPPQSVSRGQTEMKSARWREEAGVGNGNDPKVPAEAKGAKVQIGAESRT